MENNHAEKSPKRYIVLLEDGKDTSLKTIEGEFSTTITSSRDLSKDNRSFTILNKDNSIFYQNLQVVVMQDVEPEQLTHSLNDIKSPVIYFEEERDFFPVNEFNLINELKAHSAAFQQKIAALEDLLKSKSIPQAPKVELEWGLKAIGIDKTTYTGKGIDICLLDTGINTTHPDFAGRAIEGKSFIPNEEWDKDFHGHGTHCAGTAAGNKRHDTGKRYGVAPESNIKIAKVLSDAGKGSTSSIIDAIDWAITKKCRIISLSLGSPNGINEPPSPIFERVGEKALENNCLIIAAAGNDSNRPSLPRPVSCPANSKSIIAVAAIDEQQRVAHFSNAGINASTGGEINFCAPGVDIFSSFSMNAKNPALYASLKGTSMATPHVAGLAALYMQANAGLKAKDIWELMEKNAKPLANALYRDIGKGLIQAI